ncbi:MAG: 6-pyruvoyl trahydropterin synthase family protein [Candidatus Hodarchaeales archaeon]
MVSLEQNYSHPKNFFSACHFLIGFPKCDRLHGHNYQVIVSLNFVQGDLESPLDFRIVNTAIRNELQQMNQKILIPKNSPEIQIKSILNGDNWEIYVKEEKTYSFPKQDVVLLEGIEQSTSESLANYLHNKISIWLRKNYPNVVKILDVCVCESLGNQAKFSAPV